MKWLQLAAPDFDEARQKSKGVALVPVGSIEIHGPHLPVGCDTLVVEKFVEKVAAKEPVVIAPVMAYTLAPVARFHPGGISLAPELLVEHLGFPDEAPGRIDADHHGSGDALPIPETVEIGNASSVADAQ